MNTALSSFIPSLNHYLSGEIKWNGKDVRSRGSGANSGAGGANEEIMKK
jgi:hypothetical protein